MPIKPNLKRVMVIGSGPIVIGQAAEFDYAGTQACRALKEEGLEVILVNSNPATIMTDNAMADKVYIEPLTLPVVKSNVISIGIKVWLYPTIFFITSLVILIISVKFDIIMLTINMYWT